MDIDRLKQKSRSTHMFEGIAGPTAQDMADIESGHEDTGVFTAEQVEGLRRMNEKIDPAYARQRATKRGEMSSMKKSGMHGRSIGAGEELNIAALSDNLGATDQTRAEGAQYGIETSVDMGSSGDDPAASRPSVKGVGVGDVSSGSGYYGKHKGTPAYDMGLSLLETAGRCNHPRCQMIRAKGMEMIGADKRYQLGGGQFWESTQAPIPSVASYEKVYPRVDVTSDNPNGREDRKNPRIEQVLRPKDPNHPEWKALINESRRNAKLESEGKLKGQHSFLPSSFLEHHHGPEDADFEKNPLPWM